MQRPTYTYLALGDSYTIGESVPEQDNFPNQTVQLLNSAGYRFEAPVIVAKTGWTTAELHSAVLNQLTPERYSFVSLLIGVNNQYRGERIEEYATQFEELVQKAIGFAGEKAGHVYVLSIPDWGMTPFAEGRDREFIGKQIDSFNVVNRSITEKWNVNYIEITNGTRDAAMDRSLVASDGLHPSAREYKRWAKKLAAAIQEQLK